jgi:hypothetical protein
VANPVPRVRHPDWLGKVVREQDDTYKQQSVKSMFQVQRGVIGVGGRGVGVWA